MVAPFFKLEEVNDSAALDTSSQNEMDNGKSMIEVVSPCKSVKGLTGPGIRSRRNTLIYRSQIEIENLRDI
jgi:hypothetical protein